MSLKLNTAPTIEPISLYEAKVHLRTDEDNPLENVLIESLISGAREFCEGFQHRVLMTQTWELWLDAWPDKGYMEIPLPPLQSVTSVKYYDTNDTEATFGSSYYFVDTKNEPGRVALNYGEVWPSTTLRPVNGICVIFVAGYGDDAADVPQKVRQAMLLLISHWYENREPVATSGAMMPKEIPLSVEALLWQDRIF